MASEEHSRDTGECMWVFGKVDMMGSLEEGDIEMAFDKKLVHKLHREVMLGYFPTRVTTETTYNRDKGFDLTNTDSITCTIHSSCKPQR